MTRRAAPLGVGLAVAIAMAACGSFGGGVAPGGSATIGLINATTDPLELYVNDVLVGTVPPWSENRSIAISGNGGPPWSVRFLRPNGEQMVRLQVEGAGTDGGGGTSGWSSECGNFAAWWGAVRPEDIPRIDLSNPPPPEESCV